ncbi:MAG: RpiB/LacA/LacB family sugar-phosphate isomerase [Candidatus Vogelbacteria bacterium]|nr:RpiB/LacA/LacB family sugar-phosphate isomerase [Candidatus Vogelbacteria bacterium]
MHIYLGTDHAGFELKEEVKTYLEGLGHMVDDLGAYVFDPKDDYPDFVAPVARKISEEYANPEVRGVVFGRTGQAEAMVCNRFPHVRASLYYGGPVEIIALSRQHNNSNILSLSAHLISFEEARRALDMWLATEYEGGRHDARLKKIEELNQ